jgi:hypothetical protein
LEVLDQEEGYLIPEEQSHLLRRVSALEWPREVVPGEKPSLALLVVRGPEYAVYTVLSVPVPEIGTR